VILRPFLRIKPGRARGVPVVTGNRLGEVLEPMTSDA
jgi:hypothetical protein